MAARGQGQVQDFDFFVVVDFEATCVKDARIFPQEIIEFPAVLVDGATGRIESAFRRVPTRGGVVSVPGPMQGKCFFGCGNWTPAMGPVCPYFVWTN
ncbi:unnamed protein product [Triticum turgidum subsp. durum]|uniref:Exonuclease domain-containing protein n=1 Tax=Triticum turgidum subsp. durum TaxID=4567 RepID=A0A9R1S081_TRITD|nr:unnamed protein product [Triticum turgidum subsp. durum]